MKIISTFNDSLYEFSGKQMLESVQKYIPEAEIIAYEELEKNKLLDGVKAVKIRDLPVVKKVYAANIDLFKKGNAHPHQNLGFNKRWFGWFMKVAMGFHSTNIEQYKDYLLFADSDLRFIKSFNESFVKHALGGRSIGYFQGDRQEPESGFIIVDNRDPRVAEFYKRYKDFYLKKTFRDFGNWGDHTVFRNTKSLFPLEMFCDFAADRKSGAHTNSNGFTTCLQIIKSTEWGKYVEHDKGVHWKSGIVPKPN